MKLFLMRHGQPESDGARRCIGVTDVLLSESGRERTRIVAESLKPFKIKKIYTSPLQRCVSTAEIVKNVLNLPDFEIVSDLREMNMGEWDGLTFDAIQKHWPEAYQARGQSIGNYIVSGGESFAQAGERFEDALRKIRQEVEKAIELPSKSSVESFPRQPVSLCSTDGFPRGEEPDSGHFADFSAISKCSAFYDSDNVLVIAHAGAIRGCLCRLLRLSPNEVLKLPMPYGGISVVDAETFQVEQIGILPSDCLEEAEIKALYKKHQVPENVIRHMQTTAEFIDGLSEKTTEAYDWTALKKAALVHDLARTQPHHDLKTAEILRMAGYDMIARWIAAHHGRDDLPEMITPLIFPEQSLFDQTGMIGSLLPAELLFYADKRVQEDRVVSIDERFAASALKCKTPEAKAKHRGLYLMSKKIEEKLTNVLPV